MWKHRTAIVLTLAAIFSFLVAPGVAYADSGAGGMEMIVNGYHVRLIFPNPVKVGENQFQVQITGADGSPVSGAEVEVAAQPVEKTDTHQADMGNVHSHDPAPPTQDDGMGGMDMGGMNDVQPTATPADSMDGMSGMSGMDAATPTPAPMDMAGMDDDHSVTLEAGHEAGEYAGMITFPQAGHWMLVVHFTVNGEMLQAEFPLDVTSDIPASYGVLAGFFGLNAVIVVTAAVAKRKTVRR